MIRVLISYRDRIYPFLILIALGSFILSYAINSISIVLVFLFFFLDKKENIKRKLFILKKNKVFLFYIIFFMVQVIGILYTTNVSYGLKKINLLLPVLFAPGVLIAEKIKQPLIEKILEILKYLIFFIFLYYIVLHIFIDNKSLDNFVLYVIKERLGISQFYVVFIVLIPLLYSLKLIEVNDNRIMNLFFAIFFLFIIFLLGNKTSLIFLFIIISLKTIYQLRNKNFFYKILTILMATSCVLIAAYNMPGIRKKIDVLALTTDFDIETIITKNSVTYTKNTFEHRILINYISLKEFVENFPMGVGTGDYQDVLNSNYEKINFKVAKKNRLNNHNQYLAELLKTGLFGSGVFLFLLFLLYKSATMDQVFFIYLIIMFSLACLFESYLDRQHGVFIFSFMLPFFLSYDQSNKAFKQMKNIEY